MRIHIIAGRYAIVRATSFRTMSLGVYNNPKYYDIAFSFRDPIREVAFFERLTKKYSRFKVRNILELAAGNSPYARELVRQGYRYVGLELSAAMIRFAKGQARQEKFPASYVCADMKRFALSKKFDFAFVLLGSLYVKSDAELKSHLSSVSRVLRPGALYVLEGVVQFFPGEIRRQSWTMTNGGGRITTTYTPQLFDKSNNIWEEKLSLRIANPTKKPTIIEHREYKKRYRIKEFLQFIKHDGRFEYVGDFSNFHLSSRAIRGARNILVLRRK